MKTIRWGIVGCGNVTEVKSGPGFQRANNSSLTAVMRRNGDMARDYAERHGVPKWTDDAEALIGDPEVDAVYIATPPSTHKQYTLMAAAAGKPVYVEKPMGLNFAECQEMVAACQEAGVSLYVAYYRRALQRFLKVKQLLEEKAIGDVRFVSVQLYQPVMPRELDPANLPWRVLPEVSGGGLFVDLASHQFDFLDYALGPITAADGFKHNQAGHYPAEDVVSASWRFESGVLGAGVWCFTAFEALDEAVIVGSEGSISFSTFGAEPVLLKNNYGLTEFASEYPPHIQQPLIQTVVDDLLGVGTCPSTGESGARANWVMDRILSNN